jgi:hypothetical protein
MLFLCRRVETGLPVQSFGNTTFHVEQHDESNYPGSSTDFEGAFSVLKGLDLWERYTDRNSCALA